MESTTLLEQHHARVFCSNVVWARLLLFVRTCGHEFSEAAEAEDLHRSLWPRRARQTFFPSFGMMFKLQLEN